MTARDREGIQMSAATLEAAMAGMEATRAAFESSASRVGDELARLQERVHAANTNASAERAQDEDGALS